MTQSIFLYVIKWLNRNIEHEWNLHCLMLLNFHVHLVFFFSSAFCSHYFVQTFSCTKKNVTLFTFAFFKHPFSFLSQNLYILVYLFSFVIYFICFVCTVTFCYSFEITCRGKTQEAPVLATHSVSPFRDPGKIMVYW